MKTVLLPHQLRFYQKKGWIIFDSIFSEEFLTRLKDTIQKQLHRKSSKDFLNLSFLEAYALSHDLFRVIPSIKEIFQNKQLVQILTAVLNTENIRMGFDQILFSSQPISSFAGESLQSLSSIQPLLASVIICLEEVPEDAVENKLFCLPMKLGEMAIIKPSYDKIFSDLAKLNNFFYLELSYVDISSRYYVNEKDPNANFLKTLGYAAGDALKDTNHPILHY